MDFRAIAAIGSWLLPALKLLGLLVTLSFLRELLFRLLIGGLRPLLCVGRIAQYWPMGLGGREASIGSDLRLVFTSALDRSSSAESDATVCSRRLLRVFVLYCSIQTAALPVAMPRQADGS